MKSRSIVSDSLQPHGLYSAWNSPGQITGVGNLSFLQGIFPTRNQTQVSCIAGGFFTIWATGKSLNSINLFLLHNLWKMNKDLRCSLFISDIKLTA